MSSTRPLALTPDEVRGLSRDRALVMRGERLFRSGAVEQATRRGNRLLGTVRGSDPLPYQLSAEARPGVRTRWEWHCTCPYFEIYGGPCKHLLALLFAWSQEPERFAEEASLDERLAGPERARWQKLLRETVRATPPLPRLLALDPEPRRARRGPLALAPYEEQIFYALRQRDDLQTQRRALRAILELAAGYLRVEDGINAARLATLLAGALLRLQPRPAALERLLFETLTLLEAAALEATWPPSDHRDWLVRLRSWWPVESPALADRLLDLILHTYRPEQEHEIVGWLRALLRDHPGGNRLSRAAWRRRLRDFLLAYYEHREQWPSFLALCWEEGEDARAARVLVERGAAGEAVALAAEGLGSTNAHREVAAALHQRGEEEAAAAVARAGLRYEDSGRPSLLTWLAARALEAEEDARGRVWAEEAWRLAPALETYHLLQRTQPGNEPWPARRARLFDALAAGGAQGLLVEILADEEAWEAAIAHLPATGPRREALTELLARGMSATRPKEAISLLVDLAALRAEGRSRPAYERAAAALQAARALAASAGLEDHYRDELDRFLLTHRRLRALREVLARTGITEE